ncbi:hypothetical protein BDV25DRAFT_167735 [Aspergillus avenaceus]|uniref:3-hydroxyacyl-CoA dehydrogenase n=1 Tax=Aspergillus avenaceus TaxID=36643 RepID=A0A5N6U9Q2_ASPAV|nr:hypothetical protein BDV25DRAFT_167735 [Aspergillus avenaceus]
MSQSKREIKTIAVIGTGVIGASWTALFLARGLKVLVTDPAPNAETNLNTYLEAQWPTMGQTGLSEGASLSNYTFVSSLDGYFNQIDFIQENGPERVEFKRTLFAHLDEKLPSDVIIASSSSGIPSSQYASACQKHPERVLVGHPFNPPHLIPLVEVVPHPGTDRETVVPRAIEFYKSIGKKPALIEKETPGFVVNRLQAAVLMEAYSLVSRGVISAADLDTAMTSSLGLRWALNGPFLLNALAGGGSFQHFIEHLGPALKSWHDDMQKHTFKMSEQDIQDLSKSVEPMFQQADLETIQRERDDALSRIIDMKDRSSSLH